MTKLSELPVASTLAEADLMYVVQGDVSKQATVSLISNAIDPVVSSRLETNFTSANVSPAATPLVLTLEADSAYTLRYLLVVNSSPVKTDGYSVDFALSGLTLSAGLFASWFTISSGSLFQAGEFTGGLPIDFDTAAIVGGGDAAITIDVTLKTVIGGTLTLKFSKYDNSGGATATLFAGSSVIGWEMVED
jgi:methionine-rich copper-binding protein CopC